MAQDYSEQDCFAREPVAYLALAGSELVGSELVGSGLVGSGPVGSEPVGSGPVGSGPVGLESRCSAEAGFAPGLDEREHLAQECFVPARLALHR